MEKSIHTREYAVLLNLLRETREAARLTQVELAQALGKTQSYVSKIERGEVRLDLIQMRTFLTALKVSLPEFTRRLERSLR